MKWYSLLGFPERSKPFNGQAIDSAIDEPNDRWHTSTLVIALKSRCGRVNPIRCDLTQTIDSRRNESPAAFTASMAGRKAIPVKSVTY